MGRRVAAALTAGALTVAGLLAATPAQAIGGFGATKLAFATAAFTAAPSTSATTKITVQYQDASGNPASPGLVPSLTLSTTSPTGFFAATLGGSSVPVVNGMLGQNSVTFYYADNTLGTPTISVKDPLVSVNAFTQVETIANPTVAVTVTGSGKHGQSPSFTATPTGTLPDGVTVSGTPTCTAATDSTALGALTTVGSYTIDKTSCTGLSLTGTNAGTYTLSLTGGAYTEAKGQVTATITGGGTYGDPTTYTFTPTITGNGSDITFDSAAASCGSTTGGADVYSAHPGSYTLAGTSCSGVKVNDDVDPAVAAQYDYSYVGGSFIVAAAGFSVTVAGTQSYGDTSATFTPTFSDPTNVSGDVTCTKVKQLGYSVPITSTLGAGTYDLDPASCSGASVSSSYGSGDYSLTYSGTLTVAKQQIPVTVTGSQQYGGNAAFTFAGTLPSGISSSGTITCSKLDGDVDISPYLDANGGYTIDGDTCSGLTPTGSGAANYAFGYTGGYLTVNVAPFTVTVTGKQTYGGTPTFTAAHDPLPVGLELDGSVQCPTLTGGKAVAPALAVGAYRLRASECTGLSLSGDEAANYSLGYAGSTFTVAKAKLTISVMASTRSYGASDRFVAVFSGLVLGQLPTVLSGSSTFSAGMTVGGTRYVSSPTSPVGTYVVYVTGYSSPNYAITYQAGRLVVSKAKVTVEVVPLTVAKGTVPTFVLRPVALHNGDQLTGTLTTRTSMTKGGKTYSDDDGTGPTGTYYVYLGGLSLTPAQAKNYSLTFVTGRLYVVAKRS